MKKNELKNFVRKIIYEVFSLINMVVPKKKQIFVYGDDLLNNNSESLVRFLIGKPYKVSCMANKHMEYPSSDNIVFVKKSYFRALKGIITSAIVIDSFPHTIKMKPTNKQLFIMCCHGSPFKKIYNASNIIRNADYYSYIFYAADIFKKPLMELLGSTEKKMFLNGNLHSDYFFENILMPKEYISTNKKIIWMPTYREGLGVKVTSNNIPIINSTNIPDLDIFLKSKNVTLFIKPHILQKNGLRKTLDIHNCTNIVLLSEEDFIRNNIPVYGFIGCMDALITDYSGVYFDFLLTDKPIGFAIDDFEEYSRNVGFIVENPYNIMPGKKLNSIKDLLCFIEDVVLGKDEYATERMRIKRITNAYIDGKNRERCLELIDNHLRNFFG